MERVGTYKWSTQSIAVLAWGERPSGSGLGRWRGTERRVEKEGYIPLHLS